MSLKTRYRARQFIALLFLFFVTNSVLARGLSPYSMGLREAKNGIERYWALYRTHVEASKRGLPVDYRGINYLDIEIPRDAQPIPLNGSCNFRGLKLSVLNNNKDLFLFEITQTAKRIVVSKDKIDKGDFASIPELAKGRAVVFICDQTPWVEKRKGFHYGAVRYDCLELRNGKALNSVIMPYNNNQSNPTCTYITVDSSKKVISNLVFCRERSCTYKTYLVKVKNQCSIRFNNIETNTPQSETISNDSIYWIENCANIEFNNCNINGSYSQKQEWGYGIYMDNVYNSSFVNLKTKTEWGVFCTRSMNTVFMKRCMVNRFDVHCYGRNITCVDCVFYDRACSYTSFYGEIYYKRCIFENCLPVHIDDTYEAYTPFHLIIKNCFIKPSRDRNCVIYADNLLEKGNIKRREELKLKQWPTVSINGLIIETSDNSLKDFYLFRFSGSNYLKRLAYPDGNNLPTNLSIKRINNKSHIVFHLTNIESDFNTMAF